MFDLERKRFNCSSPTSRRLPVSNFPYLSTDLSPPSLEVLPPPPPPPPLMAGLVSYTLAGLAFLLTSALDTLLLSHHLLPQLHSLSTLLLSSLFLLFSLLSAFLSSDPLSPPLSLSSSPVISLFLIHSLTSLIPLFSPLVPFLSLSSFSLELLLLLLRRKDPSGIESHYFFLLLVPVLVCILSTIASIRDPKSPSPRIARAVGLALHGTWLIQMGVSLFAEFGIADGCFLRRRSWANYTVKCKEHADYHRARAIGTLQFNCHLALMVVVAVGVYSVLGRGEGFGVEEKGYRPLGKEMEMEMAEGGGENGALKFTLGSEEEEEVVVVAEARNGFGEAH